MSNPPPANQEGNASNMQAVAAVGVKLPDFWKTDPEMWFAQAEAQFTLANITRDDTKYSHIVAKVDQTVICHIADLVHRPPLENKLEGLLGTHDLGDLRPSHLLAKMQELSSGLGVESALLRMLFLQKLPTNVRGILSICNESLANIALMADKMIETMSATVASVSKPEGLPTSETDDLKAQVAALTAEVKRMRIQPSRSRSRSLSRARDDARSPSRNRDDVCWYHRKYGNNARQCREPCTFSPKN
ncbi:uncharacterized protein LOC119766161 [Culex quinquefasciatus]|uniref:uncharacterized protein LOC119766161 n=1 Tax=Culex quinquefasciatus TaxID=7176 RepID=UPI0018E387AE|nr:uncharacterized protein LOC119766161 [Culex quinquefasciatus]